MDILTHIFVVLVAIEFVYIFYLETLATTSRKTSETFGITKEALEGKNVNVLLKNQGVYNLLIAVMLLIALFIMISPANNLSRVDFPTPLLPIRDTFPPRETEKLTDSNSVC